jgi:hypothetical protein
VAHVLSIPIAKISLEDADAMDEARLTSRLSPLKGDNLRPRLVMAGAYYEEQITVCSLRALAAGCEVYALKDVVVSRQPDHSRVFDTRLVQAGVVLVTLRQLLYEWLANSKDENERSMLAKLIGRFVSHPPD